MKLIDLYIQEVTKRLPMKTREDIALELKSTIEDMLPDNYTEEDVKEVLFSLGNPAVLASNYQERPMHLIGPRYYDLYLSLLKMILPIAMGITMLVLVVTSIFSYSGETSLLDMILTILGEGIWGVISTGIQVFFWLTLVFAIIERTDSSKKQLPITKNFKEWTPDDLKDVPYLPKEKVVSKVEAAGGLIWTTIWATCYFNAENLVGVYEKGESGLRFVMPTFNQEALLSYWPLVVLIIGLELALVVFKWRTAVWTKSLAIFNALTQMISLTVFIVILRDSSIVNEAFVTYMKELFGLGFSMKWIFVVAVFSFIFSAVAEGYRGFRKALH